MNENLISVIIPAYNIKPYIERTVQSICQQTYRNLEIIIVDDGSTDGTWDVLKALEKTDSRIRVLHQENGGVMTARLTGIKAASGDWIGFVDGDDYIEPEMYEVLLRNARKYQADISHCGYQMVFSNHVDYYYNTKRIIEQTKYTGVRDLLKGEYIEPSLGNKIYRAGIIRESILEDKIDTSIRINEDLLMNYYFFSKSKKSVFEDRCFYHYMIRKGSAAVSSINLSKLRDPIKVCSILLKETKEFKEWNNIVMERYINLLINLAALNAENEMKWAKPFQTKARKKLRRLLPQVLSGDYSKRTKVLAIWAGAAPGFYNKAHAFYAHVKGTDKKYTAE